METTHPEAPAPTRPPTSAAPPTVRADEFVAWAADVDDETWRSVRIRVENLRIQRRHDAWD